MRLLKYFGVLLPVLVICCVCTGCNNLGMIEAYSRNASTYQIVANLDYESKTLSAEQKVEYINNTGYELSEVCFHLYPNAFSESAQKYKAVSTTQFSQAYPNGFSEGNISIEQVNIADKAVKYEIGGEDNNILIVPLENKLRANSSVEIDINFELTIPNCNHRFGFVWGY